jgi:lipid-A-disaccharide synthase
MCEPFKKRNNNTAFPRACFDYLASRDFSDFCTMKLYIIAGEASGDLHGSNLIRALKRLRPDAECRVWGGDLMEQAGGQLVKHYRDLAFMGFAEVVKNLRTILNNLRFCKDDIRAFRPDTLVLIDYPGFNLRIARWAHAQGIRVVYYISPQIWAWHRSRVHDIRKHVQQMLVILPFEADFYCQYQVDVQFVGHPLLDALRQLPSPQPIPSDKPIIALLPGSRRQEIQRILPVMLAASRHFPDHQFVVAGANALPETYYKAWMQAYPDVLLVRNQTYSLLQQSVAALVKSGTSTLETALLGIPQVVCYAGNPLSYQIARRVVQVKYISLVNLILDRPLVTELIQDQLNESNTVRELQSILQPVRAQEIQSGYAELRHLLGEGGASERAAKAILGV